MQAGSDLSERLGRDEKSIEDEDKYRAGARGQSEDDIGVGQPSELFGLVAPVDTGEPKWHVTTDVAKDGLGGQVQRYPEKSHSVPYSDVTQWLVDHSRPNFKLDGGLGSGGVHLKNWRRMVAGGNSHPINLSGSPIQNGTA